jgi:hypothetical protein
LYTKDALFWVGYYRTSEEIGTPSALTTPSRPIRA